MSSSAVIKTEVICPNDTNPIGILQGGNLAEWPDMAAPVCAQPLAGRICVAASINHVDFNEAAKVGDIITLRGKITRAFKISMEIFVQAIARKILAGKKYLTSEVYFTLLAPEDYGKESLVIAARPATLS